MTNQQNVKTEFFNDPKPASIRLWHWLAFLFFLASITTVIFASTLFTTKSNIPMVQEQVQQKGGSVTDKQAWAVAHEYSDKLWTVHKFIGYGLSFLILFRIIAEVTISKEKKLAVRVRAALNYPAQTIGRKHNLLVQYGYVIFYTLFIVMSVTGLVLAFEDVTWLDPVHKLAKNIHSIVQYGLYAYIVIHMVGVIRADLTKYGGIISRMINGHRAETT